MRVMFTLFCTAILIAPVAAAQTARIARDTFIDTEKKVVRVTVALDRVAIIPKGRARGAVERIAQRFELRVTKEGLEPMTVFAVPGTRKRDELLLLAARLRSDDGVEQAGVVVRGPGQTEPSMMTNELVVRLDRKAGGEGIERVQGALGARILMQNPFVPGQYLLALPPGGDPLRASERVRQLPGVVWALPNFVTVRVPYDTIPNDPLFANQWHHRNTGASGGTATADARTSLAWDLTLGAAGTVLQINELGGTDITHEDLAPNRWNNTNDVADGTDNNGNGLVDDTDGWNFTPCTSTWPCGSSTLTPSGSDTNLNAHATSVAGTAVARGNNNLGVSGSCPNCRFTATFFSPSASDFIASLPFGYGEQNGVAAMNNSWGSNSLAPLTSAAISSAVVNGRGGLGMIVFFAAGNSATNPCGANPYVTNVDTTVISSSSNQDRKVLGHCFGNCVSMLAPTRWSPNDPVATGTLAVSTTDRSGTVGYNSGVAACIGTLTNPADDKYTHCFSGTSSASPLAAGVAGLVATTNPNLTAVQIRRLLQDTSDKIQDSTAAYATVRGFSTGSGAGTHGFGRVNAFEAVRVASPTARNGTDIFIRDNRLDWGNTDHASNTLLEPTRGFIPHWVSVDIKVDAPPYQSAPVNQAQFEAFADENPESGSLNKVYVRVRNRGPVSATSVIVKLHWAFAGLGLPALPAQFWTNYPADTPSPAWNSLGTQPIATLAYSGASVADSGGDLAQIAAFDFPGPPLGTGSDPSHFCLFAVIDSAQDRPAPKTRPTVPSDFIPDAITPVDNNVTHRNVHLVNLDLMEDLSDRFVVSNPTDKELVSVIRINAPRGWSVKTDRFEPGQRFTLKPRERVVVKVSIVPPDAKAVATIDVMQEMFIGERRVIGGMTYRLRRPRTAAK